MGLNDTPSGNRIHISFFGRRNVGKSSLVNAVTNQEISIVSDKKGTTTDPVYKAMELLPLGPVLIIDTPGIDDVGSLGEQRIERTKQVLRKTDIAVLVVDTDEVREPVDRELLMLFQERNIPYLIAFNKSDMWQETGASLSGNRAGIVVSAKEGVGINELKERIAHLVPESEFSSKLVGDLLHPLDVVVLVVPIDSSAPKGRLILPQQQVIRDVLEAGAISVVVKDTEFKETLEALGKKPALVITDSQVFKQVAKDTPENVSLTSFSILMARKKGFLTTAVKGAKALEHIQDGDRILIAEGCTHHRQCEDIGTVKLPNWIRSYTGKNPIFEFTSGTGFPEELSRYKMVVHCGGCTLNDREMEYRMQCGINQGIPFTNYGTLIAYINGILARAVEVIPEV